jgi:hypothetical protein
LLQALARLERPVTRRQLAATAGVNAGHGRSVIEDFVSSGLVTEMKVGRASLVALNRDYLAAQSLLTLAGLRGELIRRLRERLKEWPDLSGAWLFGSVARGQSDSDIDIDIVATDLDQRHPCGNRHVGCHRLLDRKTLVDKGFRCVGGGPGGGS